MSQDSTASSPLSAFILPNGQSVKNRIVKASMEEGMGDANQAPDQNLFNLYRAWSEGGVGAILTGNVMIDRLAMTRPGGVVLEKDTDLSPFKTWASHAQSGGSKVWMQINHPGRQVFANMKGKVLSPSSVALKMGKHSKLFGQPKAMTESDINDVIQRFVDTALQAEKAGFDGVQIHAAHGYLIAQFLSPLTNQRDDDWGGALENRARILLSVVQQIKQQVSADFTVAVKLNSADFQRGGFDLGEAKQVVKMLQQEGIDFVELSGGSYESPAMQGKTADGRTLEREAYFLKFAKEIAESTQLPVMTTGGIRRFATAEQVVNSGPELVGIASALAFAPDLVNKWQHDKAFVVENKTVTWKDKTLAGLATMALVTRQLRRLGKNKSPKPNDSPFVTLLLEQLRKAKLTKRYLKRNGLN
ncbi:MAG: NADH:flavin oxidoreductase/NADH oxidase family protein [Gammaproteobacteria bacterium]|nr:NADH:flavin oxidoreductase/NADH oxidase family protein [Gammaproteobacteria bacterium]